MLYLESSPDNGVSWARTGAAFKLKAAAKAWFETRWPSPASYEWRVGFLVREPDSREGNVLTRGLTYRLVHTNGTPVKF